MSMTKSEDKTLAYLRQMFPGYVWAKTAGGGQLDYMGVPPPENDLPMLFVESKMGEDRTRESQNAWAKSEVGLRCRKYVIYSPDDKDADCFFYTWDDWMLFVEREDIVARMERKIAERRAGIDLDPGLYSVIGSGAKGSLRIDVEGVVTLISGSSCRLETTESCPESILSRRHELLDTGKLVKDGKVFLLKEDIIFTSTSLAAGIVLGRSASGPRECKKVLDKDSGTR
jgi:hypothetical protein